MKVPIEISAHHFHATESDYKTLFGDRVAKPLKNLSQTGQFASDQTAILESAGEKIEVRFLGPCRPETQVEITKTEARKLKIDPPMMECNCQHNGAKAKLVGPAGFLEGPMVIVSERHLHINTEKAKDLKLQDGQKVAVEVSGPRGLIFKNVLVRVDESFTFDVHLDTDEANAAAVQQGDFGELIV